MKKWTIIIIIAIFLGVAGYLVYNRYTQARESSTVQAAYETVRAEIGALTSTIGATGTVRSNQAANLVWKTTGTVGDVFVEVGDEVEAGEKLAELSQTSLPQNVILAQADYATASETLDDLLNSRTQSALALKNVEDAEQALEDAQNPELAQARALKAIADAEKAVEDAQRRRNNLSNTADQTDIDIAKAELALAEKNLERAEDLYEPYRNRPESNLRRAQLLSNFARAQQQYDAAVRKLNALQGTGSALDIAVADADLATFQAQLLEAQREYERVKNGATPAEIALLEAQLADAKREWERVKDGPTETDILAAQARVDAAEATLRTAWLEAPFTGTIMVAEPQVGDQVSPEIYAFRLDDLSRMFVDLDVSEIDINQIQPGQEAAVTFDAIRGKEYSGEVVDVGLVGRINQGVVYYTVTVEILDPDNAIRPGMTSAVDITINQSEETLLVPNQAIRVEDGDQIVYLTDGNGNLIPVKIVIGFSSDTYSQVLGGDLLEGDLIVLNPQSGSGIEELNFFNDDPENMRRMRELREQFEPEN